MNANSHQDATTAAVAMISTNMLQQIIALQQAINSREPQQRFPTMQEASLLTKMIVGLEKLKRFITPPKQSVRSKAATENQPTRDEDLFEDGDQQSAPFVAGLEALAISSDERENIGQSLAPVETATAKIATNAPEAVTAADGDAMKFPISESEFSEYRHLLHDTRMDKNHTTLVNGVAHNTNWLQYNLFQYTKPVQDRRFFYHEARYRRKFKHGYISRLIENYLRQPEMK